MAQSINTSDGDVFSEEDTRDLAKLVYKRFGKNLGDATNAWKRMLGNNCSERDFGKMVLPLDDIAIVVACPSCDSTDVTRDALATWSLDKQDWELSSTLDAGCCNACGEGEISKFRLRSVPRSN